MPRHLLPLLLATGALAACGPQHGTSQAVAAPADACPTWIAETKAMCADFVDGREVAAECARHAIVLQTTFSQPEAQDPRRAGAICATQLSNLRRDQAERPPQPSVHYGDACTAFAARLRRACVDNMDGFGDFSTCTARYSAIAIARAGTDEQRESICEMGLAMQAR
jgi:hypothetical protein